ncbi:chloride channel protein [Streptomyces sp. I6]|uniref:chloride channel protein n=1 Tax=Streptomyces sp. I6 TaxID=2483113 RepID=UPI0028806CC7|nr:chloride channel protein [Streptomyces sp. I6]
MRPGGGSLRGRLHRDHRPDSGGRRLVRRGHHGAAGVRPGLLGVGALLAVLAFKGIAYALCLGSLRGGPIFPALFLGAATGVLLAPLPGFGVIPGMAAGMAASAGAALRLPVSSVVLVALLLGSIAMTPVVILAAVVAIVTTELLPGAHGAPPPESAPAAPAAPAGAGAARGAP